MRGAVKGAAGAAGVAGAAVEPNPRRWLIDLVLLGALWGASLLFMRIAAPEFGALPAAAVRVGIAALFLLPLLLVRGHELRRGNAHEQKRRSPKRTEQHQIDQPAARVWFARDARGALYRTTHKAPSSSSSAVLRSSPPA